MLPTSEVFTSHLDYLAWLDTRPAEEHYEVVDGTPVVSPGPNRAHQRCLIQLAIRLGEACPDGFEVLPAPFDWVLWEAPRLGVRQPDLIVCERVDDPSQNRGLNRPPLLAVEILSPTSVERDVITKRHEYAAAGLDHYWIVDPEAAQIRIYRRDEEGLELDLTASGRELLRASQPFPITLRSSELL